MSGFVNVNALFGHYHAGQSVVHLLDPRTKLVCALALIVAGFCAQTPWALAVCALFTCLLYAIARIPVRVALRSVAPLMFIVIITVLLNLLFVRGGATLLEAGPLCITEQGVRNAVFFGVRLTVFLLVMCLLLLTTTALDVTDASEKLLQPLARVGVPVHELATMMGIALRFLPQFALEARQIRQAQVSRGSRLPTSPAGSLARFTALAVPLFTGVFRRADTLAAAMDARCYRGGSGRTRLHPMAFTKCDAAAVLVVAALFAAVLLANMLK